MLQYIAILRPVNCIMAGIATLIGAGIATEVIPVYPATIAFLVAFIICGAGNTINDYFDYEIDKINAPHRPIPSGKISLTNAYRYALLSFVIGISLTIFIGSDFALGLALLNSLLLYAYAWRIKRSGGLMKNLTISYLVASPFLFGGAVVERPVPTLLLVALAGLANTGREMAKDIEDYAGDSRYSNTLAISLGKERTAVLATAFVSAAVLLSPLPYLLHMFGKGYIALLIPADLAFLYSAFKLMHGKGAGNASRAQRYMKIGMALALGAFLLGRL